MDVFCLLISSSIDLQTRSGIIRALEIVGFAEKVGVVSESSPGVFLQVLFSFSAANLACHSFLFCLKICCCIIIIISVEQICVIQGSLVYGREGQEIFKAELDQDVCRKVNFQFSI